MKYILAVALFFLATTTSSAYSERAYQMMQHTKKAIFLLVSKDKDGRATSHATGFMLRDRGKTFMVTALHVCDGSGSRQSGHIWAKKGKQEWKLNIIKRSKEADICLLQVPKGKDLRALSLAKKATWEEKVYIIGHPAIMHMTSQPGRLKGIEKLHMPVDYMPIEECNYGYYHVHTVQQRSIFGFEEVKKCFVKYNIFATSVETDPGSSGGPLINNKGQVLGVISILKGQTMGFGHTATLKDLRKFIHSK